MSPKKILESEGFVHVYEWHDDADTEYVEHAHKGKVAIFVTEGSVTFYFSNDINRVVRTGERYDVPVGIEHKAKVGSSGCDYVVGEMIEGDS